MASEATKEPTAGLNGGPSDPEPPAVQQAAESLQRLADNVGQVIRGQETAIRKVLAALVGGGHVLLEDYPGTGKTTLAKALSKSISESDFTRVQFTPDLLPSDILGVSIWDQNTREFRFQQGPIFTHILLADEINRASPRTQSALLEAMGERQVTIEGRRYAFDQTFFVIATQNPVEFRGTYPLPEAQMDRFALQCTLGYLTVEEEMAILSDRESDRPLESLQPVLSLSELQAIRHAAENIRLAEEIKEYIVRLVAATRQRAEIKLPASPRASLTLMRLARVFALLEKREFVIPEDVQALAQDVLAHRIVLDSEAAFGGRSPRAVVSEILESEPVPA
ncbi:MAG: MoxR family ATPase [Verrucomicrobiota bacterium]